MNHLLVSDQIRVMRLQEETIYQCRDYLHSYCSQDRLCDTVPSSASNPVNEECREKICHWFYQLISLFELGRETVAVAMSYLDRFLSSESERAKRCLCNRKEYQLAAITALYMAIKIFDEKLVETKQISQVSHGVYSKKEVETMEMDMLFGLDWRLNGPTVLDFAQLFLALLSTSPTKDQAALLQVVIIMKHCRVQSEIAASSYFFVSKKPSMVALASIYNALDEVNTDCLTNVDRCILLRLITDLTGIDPLSNEIQKIRLYLRKGLFVHKCENDKSVHSRKSSFIFASREMKPRVVESSVDLSPKYTSGTTNCRRLQIQHHVPTRQASHVSTQLMP